MENSWLTYLGPFDLHDLGLKIGRYQCRCGTIINRLETLVRSGRIRSCGCSRKQPRAKRPWKPRPKRRTHGLTATPEFNAIRAAKQRCSNPDHPSYRYYGARGITVCQEWHDDPRKFVEHIGPKPSPRHSLDRIDSDGHYEPGNVRWALERTQKRNMRNNVWLEAHGKRMIISDWSRELGIAIKTIKYRIDVLGWPLDKVLSSKRYHAGKAKILLTHNGKTMCLRDWATEIGVSPALLTRRRQRGLSVDQILAPKKGVGS